MKKLWERLADLENQNVPKEERGAGETAQKAPRSRAVAFLAGKEAKKRNWWDVDGNWRKIELEVEGAIRAEAGGERRDQGEVQGVEYGDPSQETGLKQKKRDKSWKMRKWEN